MAKTAFVINATAAAAAGTADTTHHWLAGAGPKRKQELVPHVPPLATAEQRGGGDAAACGGLSGQHVTRQGAAGFQHPAVRRMVREHMCEQARKE